MNLTDALQPVEHPSHSQESARASLLEDARTHSASVSTAVIMAAMALRLGPRIPRMSLPMLDFLRGASAETKVAAELGAAAESVTELEAAPFTLGYPKIEGQATAAELGKMMPPANKHFEKIGDLSLFEKHDAYIPDGRRKTDQFNFNESKWLSSLEKRFNAKDIDENTLVVTNTGHNLPIAYAMAQRFKSDVTMHLPFDGFGETVEKVNGNAKRILDQGQTFIPGIRDALASGQREGSSTLLSFDLHMERAVDFEKQSLPSAKALKEMGITRVFFGTESRPRGVKPFSFNPDAPTQIKPVLEWLNDLKKRGVNVVTDGLDERDRSQLRDLVLY